MSLRGTTQAEQQDGDMQKRQPEFTQRVHKITQNDTSCAAVQR